MEPLKRITSWAGLTTSASDFTVLSMCCLFVFCLRLCIRRVHAQQPQCCCEFLPVWRCHDGTVRPGGGAAACPSSYLPLTASPLSRDSASFPAAPPPGRRRHASSLSHAGPLQLLRPPKITAPASPWLPGRAEAAEVGG